MPATVVTLTGTEPEPAGDVAVIWPSESTVKEAAGFDPNFTAVAPSRSAPVTVTDVPPPADPEVVPSAAIVGTGWTSALNPIATVPALNTAAEIPSAGTGSHWSKVPRPEPSPTEAVALMSRPIVWPSLIGIVAAKVCMPAEGTEVTSSLEPENRKLDGESSDIVRKR